MTRREFLKKSLYALLSLPLFAIISKLKKSKELPPEIRSREAMYYKNLAG